MFLFAPGFLYFWGIVFIITTTLVWLLKKEKPSSSQHQLEDADGDGCDQDLNIFDTYKLLLKIFKLPTIQWTVVFLLTCKVRPPFSPASHSNQSYIY